MYYDFDTFLNSVKYLDRDDILTTAYARHKALDKNSTMFTTEARLDLQNSIGQLLYWLEKGECPPGMSDREFLKFKPLCENLVKKNQLEKTLLNVFS